MRRKLPTLSRVLWFRCDVSRPLSSRLGQCAHRRLGSIRGDGVGDDHLPALLSRTRGADADERLPVLLRLPVLWHDAQAANRRLLRLLFLLGSGVSTETGRVSFH